MKSFINLGVKKKLTIVFSIVCIFIVLIGLQGILSSAKINKGANEMYSINLSSIKDLEEIKGNLNDGRANMLRIVFERDKSKLNEQIKIINDLTNENGKWNEEYENLPATSEEEKIYSDFKNDLAKYREVRTKVIALVKANNYDEAVTIYNSQMVTIRTSMVEKLNKCIEINAKSAEQANLNNIAQFNEVRNTI